jgi:hypothetical protein
MPDKEGWYPDPEFPGVKRYWDGSRWGSVDPSVLEKNTFSVANIFEPAQNVNKGKKSFYAKTLESRVNGYTEKFDNYTDEKKKTIIFLALIMFISLSAIFGIFSMTLGGYNYARSAALDLRNNFNVPLIDGEYEMVADGAIFDGEKCSFIGHPKSNSLRNSSESPARVIIVGTGVALCDNAKNGSIVKFSVKSNTAAVKSVE